MSVAVSTAVPAASSVRRGLEYLLAALLTGSVAWCLHAIAPAADAGVGALALVFLWFATPGVILAVLIYGWQTSGRIAACLIGPVWGFALSSLVLLALWVTGVRHPLWLALAPAVAVGAVLPWRRLSGSFRLPVFSRADLVPVLLVLLLVPLLDGRPFARVGERLPEGKAFRAYFNADTVWAMAEIAEVGKGDVPPKNPFLRGEPLHYYWFANLLSSVEHRSIRGLEAEEVLLSNAMLLGLAFVASLYFFVRHFVHSPPAAAAGCIAVLLFSSFEGAYALWVTGGSLEFIRNLNVDAVSRWMFQGMPIDGLHRLLWYQPHHAVAWGLSLSALLVLLESKDKGCFGVNLLAGSVLSVALLLSPFPAIMVGVAIAAYQLTGLVLERRWRRFIVAALAGAAPVVAALLAVAVLRYVDREHGTVATFGRLNPLATHNLVPTILLSFGPLLLGGAAGIVASIRRRADHLVVPVMLTAVGILFYFFVDVPEHQHVYVGFRAGHLLFLAGAPLVAFGLQELWREGWLARAGTVLLAAAVALAAAPTTVLDFYNTSDTSNRRQAPFGRWTYIVTTDELEALAWIRTHTPADAIVQVEPVCRGRETWFFIPAFAERRMAAGLPTSMVPLAPYQEASNRVRDVFQAATAGDVLTRARALGIQYLVVGAQEMAAYPQLKPALDEDPSEFQPLFQNGTVAIYKVT